MTNKNILNTLCINYGKYSNSEKKVVDYILQNKEEVVEMSISNMAKKCKTSVATVSRLSQHLGFKSYSSFKLALSQTLIQDSYHATITTDDISLNNINQSLQNILGIKISELSDTFSMINPQELKTVINLIENASIVQIVAVGNTIPVALDAAFKFNELGVKTVTGTILETQTAFAANLSNRDVLIVISNSGRSKRLEALIDIAKENNAKIISITNDATSVIATESDFVIKTAARDQLLTGEFWFSRNSANMIIEVLYLFLFTDLKNARKHILKHEATLRDDKYN